MDFRRVVRARRASLLLLALLVWAAVPDLAQAGGLFATASTFPVIVPGRLFINQGVNAIAAGDYNGDGKADLFVGTASNAVVFLSQGNGAFFAADLGLSTNLSPWETLVGDFNGDGRPDVVTFQQEGTTLYPGQGDGAFQKIDLNIPNFSFGVQRLPSAVGDLNHDRMTDLVVAVPTARYANPPIPDQVLVYIGNASGLGAPAAYPTLAGVADMTVGDFNGDGKPDVVTVSPVSPTANTISLFPGNGDGTLGARVDSPISSPVSAGPVSRVLSADFNGDGKLDLAVLHAPINSAGPIGVLLGNGDGTFGPETMVPGSSGSEFIAADLNGDHKSDLAVVTIQGTSVAVFLGSGDGAFTSGGTFEVSGASSIVVGDFDGDGFPDIATGNQGSNSISVLLNRTRPFLTTTLALPGPDASQSIARAGDTVGVTVSEEGLEPLAAPPTVTVTGSCVDPVTIPMSPSGAGVAYSGAYVVPAGSTDCPVTFRASGQDADSHLSTGKTVTIVVDRTPPSTDIILIGPHSSSGPYAGPVSVRLTASDAASGVARIQYSVDNPACAPGSEAACTVYSGPFTVSGDGAHAVYYFAQDNAGNSEARRTAALTIDPTVPGAGDTNSAEGTIVTVAGGGAPLDGLGDNGPALQAALATAEDLALDRNGDLFVEDQQGSRIRKIDRNGIIATVAGGGGSLADGIPATQEQLGQYDGFAVDAGGNLYIGHSDKVRKVDVNDLISTVAGGGKYSPLTNLVDGVPALGAPLSYWVSKVAITPGGELYIVDGAFPVYLRKVDTHGIISTIPNVTPDSLAADPYGNVFVLTSDRTILKVAPGGTVATFSTGRDANGGLIFGFPALSGIAVDVYDNVFVADSTNNRIRKVAPDGTISLVAGGGNSRDGGPALTAKLIFPRGIAVDDAGDLYLTDNDDPNHLVSRIREIVYSLPVAHSASASLDQGASSPIRLYGIDPISLPLSFSIVTPPNHGTLSPLAGDRLTYTPAPGYFGPDGFTFKASDGRRDSNLAMISLLVNPVNQAPVAQNSTLQAYPGTPVDLALSASDPDNDAITYTVVTPPSHGTLAGIAPHLVYTANPGYLGLDTLTFKANDGSLDSNPATVTISVAAPLFTIAGATVAPGEAVTVPILASGAVASLAGLDLTLQATGPAGAPLPTPEFDLADATLSWNTVADPAHPWHYAIASPQALAGPAAVLLLTVHLDPSTPIGTVYTIGSASATYSDGSGQVQPAMRVAPGRLLVIGCTQRIKGDVDGDGKVGIGDAILALQMAVLSAKPANACALAAADVKCSGSGTIDLGDAILILQHVVLGQSFPGGCK